MRVTEDFRRDLKEAAGVCGGRGQVMEKVRECGLKLSCEGALRSLRGIAVFHRYRALQAARALPQIQLQAIPLSG
jgi:hypothetical protein